MKTHVVIGMQPDLILSPAERTEDFSLCGGCATSSIEDAERVVRVARENDVVERFTLPRGCLEDHVSFFRPDRMHGCREVQLRRRQLGEYRFDVRLTLMKVSAKMCSFSHRTSTHLPPLNVSHGGFPVICIMWWVCMNRISLFIGKSMENASGGLLHNAAAMGYNTKKGEKLMENRRNGGQETHNQVVILEP